MPQIEEEMNEVEDDVGVIPEKINIKPVQIRNAKKYSNTIIAIIVTSIVLGISAYIGFIMNFSRGQIFLMLAIEILIAVLLWIVPTHFYMKQFEEPEEAGIKEGWMVTWMDRYRAYSKAPKDSTLILIYGRYRLYTNGRVESIPSTFNLTFYRTEYVPFQFNPNIRGDWLIYKQIESEYGDIVWADGTDRYMSAFERDLDALEVDAP